MDELIDLQVSIFYSIRKSCIYLVWVRTMSPLANSYISMLKK